MLPVINDFPHMHLQFRKKDNQYPPFGWAQHTAHLFGRMTCHIGPQYDRWFFRLWLTNLQPRKEYRDCPIR